MGTGHLQQNTIMTLHISFCEGPLDERQLIVCTCASMRKMSHSQLWIKQVMQRIGRENDADKGSAFWKALSHILGKSTKKGCKTGCSGISWELGARMNTPTSAIEHVHLCQPRSPDCLAVSSVRLRIEICCLFSCNFIRRSLLCNSTCQHDVQFSGMTNSSVVTGLVRSRLLLRRVRFTIFPKFCCPS